MPETLTRLTLAALAASLCLLPASAQAPARPAVSWVDVAPAEDGFVARMPEPRVSPAQVQEGGLSASGRRYEAAGGDGTTFVVWSLKDSGGGGARPGAGSPAAEGAGGEWAYLDRLAELAWGLVVRPEAERLGKSDSPERAKASAVMAYESEFRPGRHPARAYSVTLDGRRGAVYLCSEGGRIYVVAALAPDAQSASLKQFADSFALKGAGAAGLPDPSNLGAGLSRLSGPDGIPYGMPTVEVPPENGAGGRADDTRPFDVWRVTKKAVINSRPEPGYTEEARKFNVKGVVALDVVLAATGQVTNVTVIKRLPHGLTEKAIAAAKSLKFEPAQKDGRVVSQYALIEYNFNTH